MNQIFITLVNGSYAAGWLVLALVLLRPLIKRAPRWISVALWGLVALRLVCPVFPESSLSLVPSAQVIVPEVLTGASPSIQSGIPAVDEAIDPVVQEFFTPGIGDSVDPLQVWLPVCAGIWCLGVLAMGVYAVVSWLLLKRRVCAAVLLRDNIYQSEWIRTPFVLGLLKPRIYLPFGTPEGNMEHILAHERSHIRRKDHWWKPIGYALLALHWFHPLMWLAYILLCRDIEVACDEKVIRRMDAQQRADYSQTMLRCGADRRYIVACPVAFGEVGVKARIKHVLIYKKPAFWIILAALILCFAVAVCFLTNPAGVWSAVQLQENLYVAGDLVGMKGEMAYMPKDGSQLIPEIRIGAEGLRVYAHIGGMKRLPYVQIEWLTRDELVEQLSLPVSCTPEEAFSYGYWTWEGDLDFEKAVPQCEQVTICKYRENEADEVHEYIVYFFDAKPGWVGYGFDQLETQLKRQGTSGSGLDISPMVSNPKLIFELQPPEGSRIRPMVLYIRDGGTFAVEDYGEEIGNPYFQTMYSYSPVENYRQAGNAGIQAMADRFGKDLAFELRGCNVCYDEGDDVWLVQLHIVSAVPMFGGGYSAILKSDGTVLAVWGEK